MYILQIEEHGPNSKDVTFLSACGHVNCFKYSTQALCQEPGCTEEVPNLEKLLGSINQDNRVHFWAECDI